jgi:hypothetical protein
MGLVTAGDVPGKLAANAGPGAWAATLALVGDRQGLQSVEAIGPDALAFAVALDPQAGTVTVTPAAAVSYQGLIAAGRSPAVTLQLAFRFADGHVLPDHAYPIEVIPAAGQPIAGLHFASGGAVPVGVPGAQIGVLAVDDPSVGGPYTFGFDPQNEWRFEVVGNTLRLQPGIALGLDEIPDLPLIVTVSDGTRSIALVLDIAVQLPADEDAAKAPSPPPPDAPVIDQPVSQPAAGPAGGTGPTTQAPAPAPSVPVAPVIPPPVAAVSSDPPPVVAPTPPADPPPPSGLIFAHGGAVMAQVAGMAVGELAVIGGGANIAYHFILGGQNAWRFEVQGDLLKLASDVSLNQAIGSPIALPVTVSDGTHSTSFSIDILVTPPLPPTAAARQANGIALSGPRSAYDVLLLDGDPLQGLHATTGTTYSARSLYGAATDPTGGHSLFSGVQTLHFADGRLVFDPGDPVGQVERMYESALGRAADPLGLHVWSGYLKAGHSISELAQSFVDSVEFQMRYPAVDAAGFVTLLYVNTLGRAPDPAGLAAWTDAMAHGLSRTTMLTNFSECTEHYLQTADLWQAGIFDYNEAGAAVARLYESALGRDPELAGWQAWTALREAGMPLLTLAAQFPACLEFQLRYPSVDDAGFVTLLYRNTLGRDPDAPGLAGWTQQLQSGAVDRTTLLLEFSECLEHKLQTVDKFADGLFFA